MWTSIVSAGVGAVSGPVLATWATRSVARRPLFAAGWWRGAEVGWLRVVWFCLTTAGLTFCLAQRWQESNAVLAFCWFAMTAVVLGVIDAECQRLPRGIVIGMALGGLVLLGVAAILDGRYGDLLRAAIAAAVVFVLYLMFAVVAHGGMAFGDVTLFGAVSFYLGWVGWHAVFAALMITAVLGGVTGLLLIAFKRVSMKERLAYGPVIVFGAAVALMLP
jgi:leader peptidase (prepilin peptidase) / N-methyltransferase